MIIFVESGRLGNQLFQYAALRTLLENNERMVLFGFDDLLSVFDGVQAKVIPLGRGFRHKLLSKLRPKLEQIVDNFALVGVVSETFDRNVLSIQIRAGLIGSIRYAKLAYFQAESAFSDTAVEGLRLKRIHTDKVQRCFADLQLEGRKKVFVHIRRGDFLEWPSRQYPAVLPASWYYRCIERLRGQIDNPFFFFVSDDVHYVMDVFGDMPHSFISTATAEEDFALMCRCDAGILSPSSFSWWAAYFVNKRVDGALFCAPEYWGGHRRHEWHPPAISSSFLDLVPVWGQLVRDPAVVSRAQ